MTDQPHHAVGDCVDCGPGTPHERANCEIETCPGMTASCGSHNGGAMISVAAPGSDAMLRNLTRVDRQHDRLRPPPPSRIDRPPIT